MRSVMTIDGYVNWNWMDVKMLMSTSSVVVRIRPEKNSEHNNSVSMRGIRKLVASSNYSLS